MAFEPEFSVTAGLLQTVETIAALRERIAAATVQVAWIPALQKDARVRNTHSSAAIEGNPLTLEQVRELEEGRPFESPGRADWLPGRLGKNFLSSMIRTYAKSLGVSPTA